MCSQPHTYTTTHNTLQNVPSEMYTHPQKDAQSCLSTQEYACGGKGSQVGGQHGLHSEIPVSKHKQGVRKIRGTHIGTSQNMTHRGALTRTGIPHKSPIQHSFNIQGGSTGREQSKRALFLGGESETTEACYKGL